MTKYIGKIYVVYEFKWQLSYVVNSKIHPIAGTKKEPKLWKWSIEIQIS
jgi:hypothetical protein